MSPCNSDQKRIGCETIYLRNGEVKGCYFEGTNDECHSKKKLVKAGVHTGGAPKISNRYRINYLNSKNNYQKGGVHSQDHQETSSEQTSSA